jgi:CBS domain-containing protein
VVVGKVVSTALRRVVVVDTQRRAIGIITDAALIGRLSGTTQAGLLQMLRSRIPFLGGDLAERQALVNLREQRAQDVMQRDPVVIPASATIVEAIQRMMEHHIKRLPVVDQQGRLVGMVDRQALLRALSQLP